MRLNALEEQSFDDRLSISQYIDQRLIKCLCDIGHLTDVAKSSLSEDKDEGIDYWFSGDPIQWKVRMKPKQVDVPVCYSQPFHGYDSPGTKWGRDYKGLVLVGKTVRYYVAIKNKAGIFCEVYMVSTNVLRPLIATLEQEWEQWDDKFSPGYHSKKSMTKAKSSGWIGGRTARQLYGSNVGQVWWKKNYQDKSPKINFYFPSSLKEQSFEIPESVGLEIKNTCDKLMEEAEARRRAR